MLTLAVPFAGCGAPKDFSPSSEPDQIVTRAVTGSGMPTPAGWWSFDEKCATTTVYDTLTVPATANGSKVNGAGCVEGQIGRAVALDGVDDSVSIPDRPGLHFTTAMTISAWVKPASAAGFIAGKWDSPNSYRLSLTAGKPVFSLTFPGTGSGMLVSVTGPSALPTAAYSHVAGVYDGAAMRLYVNGIQVATIARSGAMLSSNAPVRVGKLPSGSPFAGSVDELRLCSVGLTPVQVNRLVNGLQHRRLRGVAFDPKFAGTSDRLHTYYPTYRTPEAVLQYWADFINEGAGETVFLPEDGDYASAIRYVEEVPYNNTTFIGSPACQYVPGNNLVSRTAEQYRDLPNLGMGDIFRMFKSYNPGLSFDLIADANGQYFHEMIVIQPRDWGHGKEGVMVANTNDGTAYADHDGIIRDPNLQMNKKFTFHGVGFERFDSNLEQYMHRWEAGLSHVFSENASADPVAEPCGAAGWWRIAADPHTYGTPFDLFTTQDTERLDVSGTGDPVYVTLAEAHVGQAHRLPNTIPEYARLQESQVPSNYQFWSTFPQGYPFDLTRRNRRVMVSCETWTGGQCTAPFGDRAAMVWQLQQLPKADGTFDGRSNNWWKYLSNPNYQVGRGLPMTKPVVGPFHGGMDFTLSILPHNILLTWKTEVTKAGSYEVQWSTNRQSWFVATALPGTAASWLAGLPAPGVDTFYRVRWINGGQSLLSDVLGANLGGATIVDVNGGQRPPVNLTISLYQQGVPYVRWAIPDSCGLSNGEAHAPCTLSGTTCASNVCRGGDTFRVSDYHDGLGHHQLLKRESGYANIRSIKVDGYSQTTVTGADPAAASGAVSGYRAIAYRDDGSGNGLGAAYGQTDVVLAVPNQATVGN